MGQKVNPIGLRLGVNKTWQSRWYANSRDYADLFLEDMKIRKLVGELPECKNADIAEIEIVRHPQRVTIVIHTARPGVSSVLRVQQSKRSVQISRSSLQRKL